MGENSKLAKQWIHEQLSYDEKEGNAPAIDEIIRLGLHNAQELWPFILDVIEETGDAEALNILGAGPLEDLIIMCGQEFYDRIEEQYRQSPRFRRTLKSVWIGSDKPELASMYSRMGCQIIEK